MISSKPDGKNEPHTISELAADRNSDESTADLAASRGEVSERIWDMHSSGSSVIHFIPSISHLLLFKTQQPQSLTFYSSLKILFICNITKKSNTQQFFSYIFFILFLAIGLSSFAISWYIFLFTFSSYTF